MKPRHLLELVLLAQDGGEPVGSTPEDFHQIILLEVARWRKVIAGSSITVDQ